MTTYQTATFLNEAAVHPETGEVLYEKGANLTDYRRMALQDVGIVYQETVTFFGEEAEEEAFHYFNAAECPFTEEEIQTPSEWEIPEWLESKHHKYIEMVMQLVENNLIGSYLCCLGYSVSFNFCAEHGPNLVLTSTIPGGSETIASRLCFDTQAEFHPVPREEGIDKQLIVNWLSAAILQIDFLSGNTEIQKDIIFPGLGNEDLEIEIREFG